MWEKFANPSVARGKTAFPKMATKLNRFGIRFDYDKVVVQEDGTECHMFKMQANAGKIPPSIKAFRDKFGTDAVMATVLIKKDATKEEVKAALEAATREFKNA